MTRTCNDLRWGLELETTIPGNAPVLVGRYHRGRPFGTNGWKAEHDCSIKHLVNGSLVDVSPYGRTDSEFVSPILRGADGIENVRRAVEEIRGIGARVNRSCGVHVTVGFDGDAKALARLVTLVANHEKAIYASTGTRSRERGTWCNGLHSKGNHAVAIRDCRLRRYHLLNLTHLARGSNRVEFRAFAGTLNIDKILGHVCTCLGLVELALHSKRRTTWTYERRPGTEPAWAKAANAGIGEVEVRRMFYRLGWTKGHANRTYGIPSDSGIDRKAMKKKMILMARKYDADS